MIEPLEEDPADAVALDAEMEAMVTTAGIDLPQLHHGVGIASWAVSRRAIARGHSIRTGIEDTAVLEDGTRAESNVALTRAAVALLPR